MIGARVILEWQRLEPYPQRHDLSVGPKFGEIIEERDGAWVVRVADGEPLLIDAGTRRERRDEDPRWVVYRPIPTYGIGDRVIVRRSTRSAPTPWPQPDDRWAEVVEETPESLTVVDQAGDRHVHRRLNGHEYVRPDERNRVRWVIVDRA